MHAFSASGAITQYTDARQIVAEFVGVRRALYLRRKARDEALMKERLLRVSNQRRFLEMVANGTLGFGGKTKAQLEAELLELGFLHEVWFARSLRGLFPIFRP